MDHIKGLNLSKVTSFQFTFSNDELRIKARTNSRDENWTITPLSTTVQRSDCDGDPHNCNPPLYEFQLDWVRPHATPQRFNEKFKLIRCTSEDVIYATDVCIDPTFEEANPQRVNTLPLSLSSSYKNLLPIAAQWKNIGCLLNLSEQKLEEIHLDEPNAVSCLWKMLDTWLKKTETRTWTAFAEAVDPFDSNIAENLRTYQ